MVISFNGTKAPNIFAAPTAPEETSSESTGSFTDQLSSALGNQPGGGSDVKASQGQDSGARQILAAAADSSSPAPAAPAASAPAAAAVSNGTVSGEPLDDAARSKLIQAEIDAYWAGQPAAVQQLRNIGDFVQRMSMANQLASQGYSIDKSIMVWGYDPMKTMVTRQIYGYSWVPSLNQSVDATPPPGFALPGQTPYDPAHPAPGSITVSTKFADGLGISDPFKLYDQPS
jgi:hypothetical protein